MSRPADFLAPQRGEVFLAKPGGGGAVDKYQPVGRTRVPAAARRLDLPDLEDRI
ncbi:hypothetical protein [Arthrobacter sp. M4]|uniref:hypothetical protein n=1 Tax=Arthrobacter sp. M4 TaxID=218160 RepID=UPI001CDBDA07|nr:hypothetical protein [Arthrobacter sp. M4]MCA4132529.1 hypothetical protein [Arthrobacter sp. M4]